MAYQKSLIALADPTRRLVFEAVAHAPSAVGQLAEALPVSRPAVSQHLKVLSDAGLIQAEAQGTRRIYSLRAAGLADLRAYLDPFCDQALQNYSDEVDRIVGEQNDRLDP